MHLPDAKAARKAALKAALRVVLPYLVFAALWIFLSDSIAYRLAPDVSQFRTFGMVKGLLFVLISGVLLLLLLLKFLGERYAAESERADLFAREQAARARVETANRAKDELLGLVSHELRTPLTAILTSTELLDIESSLSADQRELIGTIRESVLEESRIVGDLLDATSLAAGKLDLKLERIDLHSALDAALADMSASVTDKQTNLKIERKAKHAEVLGDRKRLVQVIRNLLGNAVKFTPPGGDVKVHTRNVDASVELEVTDTGIGIGASVRDRLFEPFEQGDRSVTRNYGGLGLGLYLARSIVELHGGHVSVRSDGAGQGSAFTIALPMAKEAANLEPVGEGIPLPGCRVLVVEDNADTLKLMARLLTRIGCDVTTARSAEEAMKVATENPINLVISDIGLPDRTGWDLMRELKAKGDTPGIAISGYASDEDQARSLEAGFHAHIVKPISFAALQTAILGILRGSPQKRE